MKISKRMHLFIALTTLTMFSACGGSEEHTAANITPALDNTSKLIDGNFRDREVIGLEYSSGSLKNKLTNQNGSYTCERGKDITFSVGNILLGSAPCGELLTPIELVENADIDNKNVINMVKFLSLVDDDNNPENGIKITTQTQTLAKAWSLNFSSDNFDTSDEILIIKTDVNENSDINHTLLTDFEATKHLKSTLLCSYAGAYKGNFNGADNGGFGVLISPTTGKMEIVGYSEKRDKYFTGSGEESFNLNSSRSFQGLTNEGTLFKGTIKTVNSLSGNWSNAGDKGTFVGNRIGGGTNAKYRFVGNYNGHTSGLFSFDIDENNQIRGVAYNTFEDELVSIIGSVNGTTVTAKTTDNLTNITATFNKDTGTISNGKWKNTQVNQDNGQLYKGFFTGAGCQLNSN